VMPGPDGYELCERIKRDERLQRVPVILLVGTFEPFNEAEARRVGANDTLSKPFQSIRRLVDRVGSLIGSKPADQDLQLPVEPEAQTAELPDRIEEQPAVETLSTEELNVTTADTRPFPEEARAVAHAQAGFSQHATANSYVAAETRSNGRNMYSSVTQLRVQNAPSETGEVLLDLGEFSSSDQIISDEFVLDLEMETASAEVETEANASEEPLTAAVQWGAVNENIETNSYEDSDGPAELEPPPPVSQAVPESEQVSSAGSEHSLGNTGAARQGQITLDQLAPEVIDAIARRAVEHLSHKVVEDIAWEVVPELSELLIKHQLEKTNNR